MAGRKAVVPTPEQIKEMLEFSKNPPKKDVILQKKDDTIPSHILHLNANEIEEFFDNEKAKAEAIAKAKAESIAKAEAKNRENVIKALGNYKRGDFLLRKQDSENKEETQDTATDLQKLFRGMKERTEANASSGGYKKVKDKYTVKELKTIASRNNIKTTKKLDGKTVPLNKKGLVAKLKRNKVI